jgi:predicted secreted protein
VIVGAQSIFAIVALSFSFTRPFDRPNAGHSYVVVSAQFEGTEQKTVVRMDESQRLLVVLPWQATGYTWRVSHYDKAFLDFTQLDENGYQALVNQGILKKKHESPSMLGSVEKRVSQFHPLLRGRQKVVLHYVRLWGPPVEPAKKLFLTITASNRKADSH